MNIVCFYYVDDLNVLTQWCNVFKNFEPDAVYIVEDRPSSRPNRRLVRAHTFIKSLEELPDYPIILAAPKVAKHICGKTPFKDFRHPQDAIYLFGKDNEAFTSAALGSRTLEDIIYIETKRTSELHSFVCASIILYDRLVNGTL